LQTIDSLAQTFLNPLGNSQALQEEAKGTKEEFCVNPAIQLLRQK